MNLKTKLMDHQQKAFDKLKDIKACALFMDMGTGKTRTTLEFIEYRLKQGKITNVFWVCPVSCKENLRIDIEKHTNYSVNTIEKYNDELICIIGTESISMSEKIRIKLLNLLKNNPENYLIIDESHMIKNYDTNRTKFINKNLIKLSKYRAILTGTPVTQGIWDLYTQFYFLHPKILGYNSWHSFASNHLEYSDKFPGMIVEAHNTDYITKKINPYVYQVTKDECLNLPNKSYSYRSVYFDEIEEEYYNLIKDYYIEQIDPDRPERISFVIFKMLNLLHRMAIGKIKCVVRDIYGGELVKIDHKSTKRAKEVNEIIKDIGESKVIVWYRYNTDLELLEGTLTIKYTVVNGAVSQKQREKNIKEFRTGEINVLLINISSGAYGLNLQEANYMIYYNNSFDYAKRIQSEDRIHRIGQTKNCHIIDVFVNCGIDRKINESIARKESLSEEIRSKIKQIKDNKKEVKKFKEKILDEF